LFRSLGAGEVPKARLEGSYSLGAWGLEGRVALPFVGKKERSTKGLAMAGGDAIL
jgi:hypothetical protein